MKTFKSTDLRRKSAEVYAAAAEDACVLIIHSGYKDKIFTLSSITEPKVSKITREMLDQWNLHYQPPSDTSEKTEKQAWGDLLISSTLSKAKGKDD